MRHRRWRPTGVLAPVMLGLAVVPVSAQVYRGLSAAQVFAAADAAHAAGHDDDAVAFYDALSHDPNVEIRTEARFRKAMLLAAQKRYADAAVVFRALLDEKSGAARVRLELARVLAAMGDDRGARASIRQAQAAGLPDDVALVVDQFANALRSPKRLGGSIEAAIAPDSNVNRATSARTLDTIIAPLTLSDDARQQSGLGLMLAGQGYARIDLGDRLALLPRVSARANLYRTAAFDDISTSALLGLEWRSGKDRITPSIGPTWRWYGGCLYATTESASLDAIHPVGRRAQLTLDISGSRASYPVNALQDGAIVDAGATIERALGRRGGIGLGLSATRQTARDPGYATTGGGGSLFGWRELGRTSVFASAGLHRLEGDDRLFLFADRRREWLYQVSGGATLRRFTFEHFAPLVRIAFERNVSSVGIYDYRRVTGDVGITRAF